VLLCDFSAIETHRRPKAKKDFATVSLDVFTTPGLPLAQRAH